MTKHSSFENKYLLDEANGCFVWQRYVDSWGYGRVKHKGRWALSHRVSYEKSKGPIATGLTIDHLCRNTLCCNPDHLEAVTIKENVLRGTSFSAKNAIKTHCKKGHEFDEKNTYKSKNGNRHCRKCNMASVRKYKLGAA